MKPGSKGHRYRSAWSVDYSTCKSTCETCGFYQIWENGEARSQRYLREGTPVFFVPRCRDEQARQAKASVTL